MCAEVLEAVEVVSEVVLKVLEAVNGVRCVLWVLGLCLHALFAGGVGVEGAGDAGGDARCAALHAGCRGG